ncbi:MAG: hypothetical protein JSV50_15715 [Desulfobacteraceae bacterium]|nr:MAG: hypothetical protein JSV50_15715 [Desulfobacteraceae bacterium]
MIADQVFAVSGAKAITTIVKNKPALSIEEDINPDNNKLYFISSCMIRVKTKVK